MSPIQTTAGGKETKIIICVPCFRQHFALANWHVRIWLAAGGTFWKSLAVSWFKKISSSFPYVALGPRISIRAKLARKGTRKSPNGSGARWKCDVRRPASSDTGVLGLSPEAAAVTRWLVFRRQGRSCMKLFATNLSLNPLGSALILMNDKIRLCHKDGVQTQLSIAGNCSMFPRGRKTVESFPWFLCPPPPDCSALLSLSLSCTHHLDFFAWDVWKWCQNLKI